MRRTKCQCFSAKIQTCGGSIVLVSGPGDGSVLRPRRLSAAEDVVEHVTQAASHGLLLVVGDAVRERDNGLPDESVEQAGAGKQDSSTLLLSEVLVAIQYNSRFLFYLVGEAYAKNKYQQSAGGSVDEHTHSCPGQARGNDIAEAGEKPAGSCFCCAECRGSYSYNSGSSKASPAEATAAVGVVVPP